MKRSLATVADKVAADYQNGTPHLKSSVSFARRSFRKGRIQNEELALIGGQL